MHAVCSTVHVRQALAQNSTRFVDVASPCDPDFWARLDVILFWIVILRVKPAMPSTENQRDFLSVTPGGIQTASAL